MADIWPMIVTGVATLSAGLGSTALIHWHARDRDRAERWDRFRAEQRQSIVDLLHAAPEWSRVTSALLIVAMTTPDMDEFAKDQFQEKYNRIDPPFGKALTAARLTIREPQLAAALLELTRIHTAMPSHVGAVQQSARQNQRKADALVYQQAADAVRAANDIVAAIERLAADLLAPEDPRRPRRPDPRPMVVSPVNPMG